MVFGSEILIALNFEAQYAQRFRSYKFLKTKIQKFSLFISVNFTSVFRKYPIT